MIRFDEQSKYVFVGDYSGQVTVLKIDNHNFSLITTLKGHSGEYPVLQIKTANREVQG